MTVAVSERQALEALYEATDGPNWANSDNWLTDAPLWDWYGLDTDASGPVVRMQLRANLLAGPIPAELGNLANLVGLTLHFNDLTGDIPQSFLTLDRLRSSCVLAENSLCVPGISGFAAWLSGFDFDVPRPAEYFCNAADITVLTGLYEAAGGDGWTESSGWLGDGAVEEW